MKRISILVAIALMAVIYSCGNSGQGSNKQNADSTVTDKQAQNEEQPSTSEQAAPISDADLYKYFSKEEISKRMQHALTVLEQSKVYEDNLTDFSPLYKDSLLAVEGFASSPKQVEKKWGKPIKKEKDEYPSEYSEDEVNVEYKYEYPHFKLTLENLGGSIEWIVASLSTDTPGYGFAGVYVGIPECNKAFIEKLFAKAEDISKVEDEETGLEKWNIAIFSLAMTELTVIFNDDGTVKKVSYFSANGVG